MFDQWCFLDSLEFVSGALWIAKGKSTKTARHALLLKSLQYQGMVILHPNSDVFKHLSV